MDFISSALLLVGLGCLLMVILFAVWGFFAKARRELTWTAVILVMLILAWLIFGDAATLLNSKGAAVELLKGMVQGDASNCKTIWDVVVLLGQEMIPNGESLLIEGKATYDLFYNVVSGLVRGVGLMAITVVTFLVTPIIRLITHIVWLIVRAVKKKKAANTTEEVVEESEEQKDSTAEETVVVSESDLGMDDVVVSVAANDAPKPWKYRSNVWGAVIGVLKGLAVIIILFAPIAGICSVLAEASPETRDAIAEMIDGDKANVSEEGESVADLLFGFVDSYYESGIGKVVEGSAYFFGDSFSTITFDSLLVIETETQRIPVREELITFVYAVNALEGKFAKEDLFKWSQAEVNNALDELKYSQLLPELMPVAVEFLYEDEEMLKLGLKDLLTKANQQGDFLELRYINWDQDIELILDAVKEVYKLDIFSSEFNYLTMNPDVLVNVVEHLGDTELINNLLPVLVNTALRIEAVENLIGTMDKNPDLTGINWKNDLVKLVGIYDTFQDLGIETLNGFNGNEFFREVLRNEEKLETVAQMLVKVANLDLFDQLLIPIAFNYATGNESLHTMLEAAGQTDNFNALMDVDWEQEMDAYTEVLKAASKLFDPEAEQMIDLFDLNTEVLKEVVEKLFEAESFELVLNIGTCVAVNLEAVKKLTGNLSFEINTDAITWKEDLLNLVEAYDMFKLLGFDSLDDFKGGMELVTDILEDNEKFVTAKDTLTTIFDSSLIPVVVAPVLDGVLNQTFKTNGLPEFNGYIKLTNLSNEQWTEDIEDILELAKDLNELNVLSLQISSMDLTSDKAIDTFKAAIETVLTLNILGDDNAKEGLLTAALVKFDIVSATPDFSEVEWENEIKVLQAILDQYKELVKLEGVDINNFKFEVNKLLNNDAFYDIAINAIDELIESDIVLAILPDVIQTKVLPLIEKSIEDEGALEGALEEVTSQEILVALQEILSVVKDAKYIGVFDVAFDKAPLETLKLNEVDRILNIVDVLLGNVLFEGHEGQVLRIVLKVLKVMDVEKGYFDGINFAEERLLILEAIETLRPILNDYKFFNENQFNIDLEYLTNQVNSRILVNALQVIVGQYEAEGTNYLTYSKLVELLLPDLYEKLVVEKNMIPDQFQGIVDILDISNMSGADLLSDIRTLVYVADQAIELNAQEFMSNGALQLDNAIIDNIIDALKDVTMFDGKGAEVIVWVYDNFLKETLAKQNINVEITLDDLAGIDFKAEGDKLKVVLHGISDLLDANGLISVSDFNRFIKEKAYLEADFANVENAREIIKVLSDLTQLDTLEVILELAFPVLLNKFENNFDLTFWKEAELTGEQLAEDVRSLLSIVQLVTDETEILTYLTNDWTGDLNFGDEKVAALQQIVAKVFELNLLKGYESNLISSILTSALAKQDKIKVEDFALETIEDWSKESETIQGLFPLLADFLEENNILTVEDLRLFIDKKLYLDGALIKNENIAIAADLLAVLSGSKLVGNAVVAILPLIPDPIVTTTNEKGTFEISSKAFQELAAEDFQADLLTLSQIIDLVLPLDLVEIYENQVNTELLLNAESLNIVATAIERLYDLNLVSKCIDELYVEALNYVGGIAKLDFTITLDDVKAVDFEQEFALLASIVRESEDLVKALNARYLKDVINFVLEDTYKEYSSWTDELVAGIARVLRPATQLQTIGVLWPVAADMIRPYIDKTGLPLAFLRYYLEVEYTAESLAEDLNTIVDIALEAVELGAIEYIFTKDIQEISLAPAANILGLVQQLHLVADIEPELVEFGVNYALSLINFDNEFVVTLDEAEAINYVEEMAMLQNVVLQLQKVLDAAELSSLSDVMTFIETGNYTDLAFYIAYKDVAYNALDAVAMLADSQILASLAPEAVVFLKDIADNANMNVDFLAYTGEELLEDVRAITSIAKDAVALGALEFIKNKELNNIDTDLLATIVDKVLALNIVNGNEAELTAFGLNKLAEKVKLNVTVEADDFAFDWAQEKESIVDIVKQLGAFLTANEANSYPGAVEFFKGDEYKNAEFWTENDKANVNKVADIVESVLELQLTESLLPYALALGFAKLDAMGYPAVFMEKYFEYEYNREKLLEDAHTLVEILINAVDLGALEYIFTKDIADLDLDYAANIIGNLYELNIVYDNAKDLFAYAGNILVDKLELGYQFGYDEKDFENVSIENEFAQLHAIVSELDTIVEDFGLTQLSSLIAFFTNKDFLDLNIYNEECVDNLIDILTAVSNMEALHEFYELAVYAGTGMSKGLDVKFLRELSQEELVQDVETVLVIVRQLRTCGLYEYINTNDIEHFDFAGINEIIAKVDEINALNKFAGEWANIVLELVASKLPYEFNAAALEGINWSQENAQLQVIVTELGQFLSENGIDGLATIFGFINSKEYAKTKFWTRNEFANVKHAFEIVDHVLDLQLANPALGWGLEYAIELASSKGLDISFLSALADNGSSATPYDGEYNAAVLKADLDVIENIFDELVAFGLKEILENVVVDDFDFNYVNNAIELLQEIQLLTLVETNWIALAINEVAKAAKLDLTVSAAELEHINFTSENALFQEVIIAASEFLFEANLNGYDEIASFIVNKDYANIQFYTVESLIEALDVVEALVKLELVQLGLNPLLEKGLELASEKGFNLTFFKGQFTNEELASDVVKVLNAVEVLLVDTNALHYAQVPAEFDLQFAELDAVVEALEYLADTHVLAEDNFGKVVEALLEGIEVTGLFDLSDVTMDEEVAAISGLINEVQGFARNWNLETVNDIKKVNYKDVSVYFAHQEEQLRHIINVLEYAKNDKLLSEILFPLLDKYMPANLYALAGVNEIYGKYAVMGEDITRIQNALEVLISLDLEAVFENQIEIPWFEIHAVKTILNEIFGMRYFNGVGRGAALVEALGFAELVDGNALDFAGDAAKLGDIYHSATHIIAQDEFPYHTFEDFSTAKLNPALFTKDAVIETLKDILRAYMDTTIYEQTGFLVLVVLLPVAEKALPEYYELLIADLSQEQLVEDFDALFNAAIAVRDSGVLNIQSADLDVLEAKLLEALELVMNTNMFFGKFEALGELVLRDFVNGFTLGQFNFEGSNFTAAELDRSLKALRDVIIPQLFDVLEALDVQTLQELSSKVNLDAVLELLADEADYDLVQELVANLVNLDVLRNNAYDLYNLVVAPLLDGKASKAFDLSFYADQESLLADFDTLVEVLAELDSLGAPAIISDYLNGTENYVIDYTRSEIANVISLVVNTQYFAQYQTEIANRLAKPILDIDYSDIDLVNEANNYFIPAYEKLAVVANELDLDTIAKLRAFSMSTFNWKRLVSDYVLGSQTVEGLQELSGSQLLAEALPIVLEKLSNSSIPGARFLAPNGLSTEALAEDYDSLLVAAQATLDFMYNEGQHVRDGKNISIENVEKAILALETVWNLHLAQGKHAEVVEAACGKLGVSISAYELRSVDWANELDAVSGMLEAALTIANTYGLHEARETYYYLKGLKDLGKVELVKEAYRLFMRDNYETTVEFFEALAASELVDVVALPIYRELTKSLSGNALILLDLSTYTNAELAEDLDSVAAIARNLFDSNAYQAYCTGTELTAAAESYIAEIIIDFFGLNIIDDKAQDAVEFISSYLGLDLTSLDLSNVNWDADGYAYAAHADAFVTLFNEVFLDVKGNLGTLGILGNEAVVEATIRLYDAFVTTTLAEEAGYWLVSEFVGPLAAKVDADSPLVNADRAKAVEFLADLSNIAKAFVNMGFFGNGANAVINLDAANGLTLLSTVLKNNTNLPAKLYEYLDKTINRVYAVGEFELNYEGISSKQTVKSLYALAKAAYGFAKTYVPQLSRTNLTVINTDQFQADFTSLVSQVADQAVLGQLLLPVARGAARMLATALPGFELFETLTTEEFNEKLINEYLPEGYELIEYAAELGLLEGKLSYKNTDPLMGIVDFLVTSELSKDNLTSVVTYLVRKLNVSTPELEAKLANINWNHEAALGNAFLSQLKYALNVSGVKLDDLSTLKNNEFLGYAQKALAELEDSYLLETLGRTLAIRLYNKVLGGRFQILKDLLSDANYTDADFVADYKVGVSMISDIIALDYFGAGSVYGKLDNKNANGEYAIASLVEAAFGLAIIEGHEQELVEKVFSRVSMLNGITVDYSLIADWSVEFAELVDVVNAAAAFAEAYENEFGKAVSVDGLEFAEISNANVKPLFLAAVQEVSETVIGQAAFTSIYNSNIKPLIEAAQPDFVDVLDLEELDPSEWANELGKLLTIYEDVESVLAGGSINGTFADLANIMAQLFGLNGEEGLAAVKADPKKYLDVVINYLPNAVTQGLTIDTDEVYDQALSGTDAYVAAYLAEADAFYDILVAFDQVFGGNVADLDLGSIETKTWQEINTVLAAVNNSISLRGILVKVIGDTITDMGSASTDVNITDLVSDAFWDQYNNDSYDPAHWTAEELTYIAQILALSKELDMGSLDLKAVELGSSLADIDVANANNFNVAQAGFKQLLQLVAMTNTLDITKLGEDGILYDYIVNVAGLLSNSDIAEFGAMPSGVAAFAEIANIIDVLEETKTLSGSMSTAMIARSTADMADLFKSIISSEVLRGILPVLVNKTIAEQSATSGSNTVTIAEFVSDEYNAINWESATDAQWNKFWSDDQLELLAKLVKLANSLGANTKLFDLPTGLTVVNAHNIAIADFDGYLASAGLYSLLQLINHTEIFDITALQGTDGIINKAVEANGSLTMVKPLGQLAASATEAEWDEEIYSVVASIDAINALVGTTGTIALDDKILELVKTDTDAVEEFLTLVNSSTILRTMLPDMMYNTIVAAIVEVTGLPESTAEGYIEASSNATMTWLRAQEGPSATMANETEWNTEIANICAILVNPTVVF